METRRTQSLERRTWKIYSASQCTSDERSFLRRLGTRRWSAVGFLGIGWRRHIGFGRCRPSRVGSGGLLIASILLFFRLLFAGFLFLVHQSFLFFFETRARGDVALAIEENFAVDESFLDHGVSAHRVVIVDDQVSVFADVNGADALIDAELDGGIQSDQF